LSIGIKQIAALANVSIGTVDRVLHKRGGVSKTTEDKILKIISENQYKKNMMASRLKLASKNKIKFAILLPELTSSADYWGLPKKGISKARKELKEFGVKVDYYQFSGSSSTSFKKAIERIFLKNYDAIITVPYFEKECNTLLEITKRRDIQVVFLDTEIQLQNPTNFIRQDSHKAGMVAGRLLYGLVGDQGKYFIVNILNDRGIQVNNKQREDGFRAFFKSIGKNVAIKTINHPLYETLSVTEEMEAWFQGADLKGVFVTNSRVNLIPKIFHTYNVSNTFLIGFDLNESNIMCLKRNEIDFLINQQPERQGYMAMKGLFNFISNQDSSELNLDIPIEIMVKEHFI
jgi:LacI family transcriptional regulator